MTGGTPDHNELAINLATLLKSALRGKPYRIFGADQRLWIPDRNLYTYPDLMVVEKPLQLQTGRTDTVINPCFIAEVLTKSTQDHDHGEKFSAYRTVESCREYLLIDQHSIHVEYYVKTPRKWVDLRQNLLAPQPVNSLRRSFSPQACSCNLASRDLSSPGMSPAWWAR